MAWILLVVALGVGAGLLIITLGYRKSIIVMLVTLLIGLGFVIWYAEFFEDRGASLISVEQVSLDRFSVETTYGDSYEMMARVRNRSADYILTAVGIELSASDCTTGDSGASCIIVGQQEEEIQIDVPAQQARDIKRNFNFPRMRPEGALQWNYVVLYTTARK